MLLIGAGLLGRSFLRLLAVDPGFSADNTLTLEVHVWARARTPEQRVAFFDQSLSRIAALPGVRAAGAVSALPFHENSIDIKSVFLPVGQTAPAPGQEPTAYASVTTTDYFKALGIPLRSGRLFTPFDNQTSAQWSSWEKRWPVAIGLARIQSGRRLSSPSWAKRKSER
jgi:hypothetical protein